MPYVFDAIDCQLLHCPTHKAQKMQSDDYAADKPIPIAVNDEDRAFSLS